MRSWIRALDFRNWITLWDAVEPRESGAECVRLSRLETMFNWTKLKAEA